MRAYGGQSQLVLALVREHPVEGVGHVGRGVDQGAVQIE